MFAYIRGLYGPRNMQHISISVIQNKRRFKANVIVFLLVYGHITYPQHIESPCILN
jgi:hypothetical protein